MRIVNVIPNMESKEVRTCEMRMSNIGGQSGVNFSEKFTKFARFTLCKLFGNFSINVANLLTKM